MATEFIIYPPVIVDAGPFPGVYAGGPFHPLMGEQMSPYGAKCSVSPASQTVAMEQTNPTLTNTANWVSTNLAKCHEMLDVIEAALHGAGPLKDGCGGALDSGLLALLGQHQNTSAVLADRLEKVAAMLGQRG